MSATVTHEVATNSVTPVGIGADVRHGWLSREELEAKLLIPPGIPGIPAISFRFWLTFAGTLDYAPRKTHPEFRLG